MFKDITLGQYFPGNSPVHRLDPRTKLLLMIAYIVAVFIVRDIWLFLPVAVFTVGATLLAQVPLSYLWRALKPLRWILIFMFVLNLLMIKSGTPLWDWWVIHITTGGMWQACYIALRLMLLVAGTSLMTLTTTPIALTDGLERLLSPFAALKFPAHELAMMMTIALRFIPTLLEEADKIMKAQLSRGADLESGNILQRAKAMVPILVPLFVSAFRRADELAMAMESRCYHGGEGRTRMHVLRFALRDAYAASVTLGLIALIVAVQALI
ncbi:MAG: energy-coupling factor transporter transmembrane protein EcfT [Clostridia bacterium]|nr:energy-coupling factor transporter transmembrane component T [Candidatus Pelethousia sp.]NCB31327.1 energy-coupling factor transporter transmembrane protein EcfT [Clostridia bacterium]